MKWGNRTFFCNWTCRLQSGTVRILHHHTLSDAVEWEILMRTFKKYAMFCPLAYLPCHSIVLLVIPLVRSIVLRVLHFVERIIFVWIHDVLICSWCVCSTSISHFPLLQCDCHFLWACWNAQLWWLIVIVYGLLLWFLVDRTWSKVAETVMRKGSLPCWNAAEFHHHLLITCLPITYWLV